MIVDVMGGLWFIVGHDRETGETRIARRGLRPEGGRPPLAWSPGFPVFSTDTFVCPD